MRVSSGRRPGRSHRRLGVPCQDSFAVVPAPEQDGVVVAVADGLGTRPLSHIGSQVACESAAHSLQAEPVWDEQAVRIAFTMANDALRAKAEELGVPPAHLATTLAVVGVARGRAVAGIVGDGAVVACPDGPRILLPPQVSEYANEVVPITEPVWSDHFRYAEQEAPRCILVFTDGLTRLLLQRLKDGWEPFAPFFEAFLPKISAGPLSEDLVPGFLEGDQVDRSWDDDKSLVVVVDDAPPP